MASEAVIAARLLARIVDESRSAAPNEAVGLLIAGRSFAAGGVPDRFRPLRNAAASPYRYTIDPAEQLSAWLEVEAAQEVIWGIVHSHVSTPAVPSATDVELAFFPDSLYLICSLAGDAPVVRAWLIRDGQPQEVPLAVSAATKAASVGVDPRPRRAPRRAGNGGSR